MPENIPLLPEILQKNGYEVNFFAPKDSEFVPIYVLNSRGITQIDDEGYYDPSYVDKALDTLQNNDSQHKKTFVFLYNDSCHAPYFIGKEKPVFTKDQIPLIPIGKELLNDIFTPEFYKYLLKKLPSEIVTYRNFDEGENSVISLNILLQKAGSYVNARTAVLKFSLPESDLIISELDRLYFEYTISNNIDMNNYREMSYLSALYDQKLQSVDKTVVTKVYNRLHQTSLYKDTIVIITSEHGEEFGEHGVIGHTTLYDLNVKIPLLMSIPGTKSSVVSQNIQSVDIAPTLLDLVGIYGQYQFDGVSLVPLISGQTFADRLIVTFGGTWQPLKTFSIRDGNLKVLVATQGDGLKPYEFYDLSSDPNEQHDLLHDRYTDAINIIRKYTLIGK